MGKFSRVGVLMGGPSAERDVSLRSGAAVAKGLRARGYDVAEIILDSRSVNIPSGVEAVFIALHGEFGEDGGVQAILRELGIPYTGAGPEASRQCFDKTAAKRILEKSGVPTPRYQVWHRGERLTLRVPMVVKPARQGSSIGVHLVFRDDEVNAALEDALRYDDDVIVEDYIAGAELTVGIVGRMALPVIEIRAPAGFYNYDAKYTKGRTEYYVPAPIPEATAAACRDLALRTFDALDCRHLGRVDFRMDAQGRLFVLELNNIPGFTETSLLPKAAKAAGMDFPELCDRIMNMAEVH
jgi:D-alanine-D-alanine ligase